MLVFLTLEVQSFIEIPSQQQETKESTKSALREHFREPFRRENCDRAERALFQYQTCEASKLVKRKI